MQLVLYFAHRHLVHVSTLLRQDVDRLLLVKILIELVAEDGNCNAADCVRDAAYARQKVGELILSDLRLAEVDGIQFYDELYIFRILSGLFVHRLVFIIIKCFLWLEVHELQQVIDGRGRTLNYILLIIGHEDF